MKFTFELQYEVAATAEARDAAVTDVAQLWQRVGLTTTLAGQPGAKTITATGDTDIASITLITDEAS